MLLEELEKRGITFDGGGGGVGCYWKSGELHVKFGDKKLGIKINMFGIKYIKITIINCGPLDDHGMEIKIRVGGHTNGDCGLSHK